MQANSKSIQLLLLSKYFGSSGEKIGKLKNALILKPERQSSFFYNCYVTVRGWKYSGRTKLGSNEWTCMRMCLQCISRGIKVKMLSRTNWSLK